MGNYDAGAFVLPGRRRTSFSSAETNSCRVEVLFHHAPCRGMDAKAFGALRRRRVRNSRQGADLIVMGSHASAVRRALLGSAASAVLREAEVPVLVVVAPDDE